METKKILRPNEIKHETVKAKDLIVSHIQDTEVVEIIKSYSEVSYTKGLEECLQQV